MTNSTSDLRGNIAPVSTRVMNLSHLLRQTSRRYGQEIGFVWGDLTWTWADIDRRVDAMAAALAAKGIGKGDRVLVQSKNCDQMFEAMFACFRIGAMGTGELPSGSRGGFLPGSGEWCLGHDLPR